MSEAPARRTLVLGGTGMLAGTVRRLIERGDEVTLVARDAARLSALRALAPERVHTLQRDWGDSELITDLEEAARVRGPWQLAVLWLHGSAEHLEEVCASHVQGTVLRVLGSAHADPSAPERSRRAHFEVSPTVESYQEVVLGFERDELGSRWLTHEEIARGVWQAIESQRSRSIVGVVEPWDERP